MYKLSYTIAIANRTRNRLCFGLTMSLFNSLFVRREIWVSARAFVTLVSVEFVPVEKQHCSNSASRNQKSSADVDANRVDRQIQVLRRRVHRIPATRKFFGHCNHAPILRSDLYNYNATKARHRLRRVHQAANPRCRAFILSGLLNPQSRGERI